MKKSTKSNLLNKRRTIIALVIIVVLLVIAAAGFLQYSYSQARKPVSDSQKIVLVEIPSGYSTKQIASRLKEKHVIKESWAFEWYVRSSNLREELKAGTYALTPSQSVEQIVDILAQGEVATDLVTIVPGSRIDQIEATLINSGFKPADVAEALKPSNYKNHPALVDKPEDANLEGYLFPESFEKTAATNPKDIIKASLDEMNKRLTPSWRASVASRGLSVQKAITLASMIESEVNNDTDRPIVAQVFLKRLAQGMRLQSDVTVYYGAIADGKEPTLTYDSPYNTFTNDGLPIGPISTVSEASLNAVRNPSKTDYLYFVAGDDGKTYFSRTGSEHEAAVEEHCKRLCQ